MGTAHNSRGWEIQEYTEESGWTALPGDPHPSKAEAYKALEEIPSTDRQLRVYEALT